MATPVVCLPVKLDAYVLNPSACGTFPDATVAPLAQPNFTFLRLDSQLMEPDVLPYHDLHNASPASANPRLTDLATGKPRLERQGVYLHWMLPRVYRSGAAQPTAEGRSGLKQPKFRAAPDRWMVLRRLHPGFQPSDAMSAGKMKWVEGWVVESNRVRNITEFGFDIDVELECAPFIVGDDSGSLDGQAEIFIGAKTALRDWTEQRGANDPGFVRLDVAGAANPLFADFTSHNSNVFSILDNFAYKDAKNNVAYLTRATASYYVLGWHSEPGEDNLNNIGSANIASIFRESFLELRDGGGVNLNTFPRSRALCHGAMYGVNYQPDGTGIKVPAHQAARRLGDKNSHPITVGTTPLDAILAYIRAHSGSTTSVEDDILHLETLLLKQQDDIDSQQEALDMLTADNFRPSQDNGSKWHFSVMPPDTAPGGIASSKKTDQMFFPTTKQQLFLATLNAAQAALDSALRELRQARWELFAKWWNFCADGTLVARKGIDTLRAETAAQATLVRSLQEKSNSLGAAVQEALKPVTDPATNTSLVEKGSQPVFSKQSDPTILVPGVENPWPVDWLKNLPVRLGSQILPKALSAALPQGWDSLGDIIRTDVPKRLPKDIQGAASTLLTEFFNLHPRDSPSDTWTEQPSALAPLYHDHEGDDAGLVDGVGSDGSGRDQWNNVQPFFPLFLEFELRYYHLDKDLWEFGTPDIDPVPGNPPRARYGLKDGADVDGKTQDERVVRGRIIVLPQPGFLLSTNIQRLFNATSSLELPEDLRSEKDQAELLTKVQQLAYLSSPITGFADHLVTLLNGTHIKPSIRLPDQPLKPLRAAVNAGQRAGFGETEIRLMDIETTKTPYADYASFPDNTIDPLKPVTHGQFKFTRLDIFDKFGQAISAIDPAPANRIPPVYPALSEYFHPQHLTVDRSQANTVGRDPYGHCQFAQYPPTINQEARINAAFLHLDDDAAVGWRPCTDWENPIWGILVVNYAEYALQVFLPDGTFYREVRLGGPSGATETQPWRPFAPPSGSDNGLHSRQFPQLDQLITRLKDKTYLQDFINTINASLASVPHTPSQYAQFLNAVVGRPLALANMGFSLELATPPVKSQSSNSGYPQPASPKLLDYSFAVKVGDKDRAYDGLVGYFGAQAGAISGTLPLGTELKLDKLLTYFSPTSSTSTTAISKANYPRISPYHLSAMGLDTTDGNTTRTAAQTMAVSHAREMTMLGILFDPFSKLHLYSGILPIASLQLPPWSLQQAMQRMTAFFHMGPLLVTDATAVRYDAAKALTPDYNLAAMGETGRDDAGGGHTGNDADKKPKGVAIPAILSAEWNWLAPFAVKTTTPKTGTVPAATGASAGATAGAAAGVATKETRWNPMVIDQLDNKPKFEKGPYMAIEGYLQLKHPITAPDTM